MTSEHMRRLARKYYYEMLMEGHLGAEEYQIYIKPGLQTALWSRDNDKHRIVIGTDIFANMTKNKSNSGKEEYLRAFLHHELAHSLWTEKIPWIDTVLRKEHLPFELFNLFEDARIEQMMRVRTKHRFNWMAYESHSHPAHPLAIFFYLIQNENRALRLPDMDAELKEVWSTVHKMYKSVLNAAGFLELIPLMKVWIQTFPDTIKYISLKRGQSPFKEESHYWRDKGKFNELIEGLDDVVRSSKGSGADIGEQPYNEKTRNANLLTPSLLEHQCKINQSEKIHLMNKMQQLFFEPVKAKPTEIASKRINTKGLAQGSRKIFKRRGKVKVVKKSIAMLVDLSGSMYSVLPQMRLLLDVVNTLTVQGVIDMTLILTAGKSSGDVFQVLPLPVQEEVIDQITPLNAAEGLANAVTNNLELLKQKDYVWFLTDGDIVGKPIDKTELHRHGIRTHAIYIGDETYTDILHESFDYVVCRNSAKALAEEIFGLIRK
jgi:hypothetical protein